MANVKIKDALGNENIYSNVHTITVPTASASVTASFSDEGVIPTGDYRITIPGTTNVAQYATATVLEAGLQASNIKKNVTILGVTGTLDAEGIIPSGNINITSTSPVNVTNYASAQIVDANLKAWNIAQGVQILGITGTHTGGAVPEYQWDIVA